jgi:hypothetical protein
MRNLCVFCGSSTGNQPIYAESARMLARSLASRGMGVVYGGGSVGIMGALADAALEVGVRVVGVIPRHLDELEVGHHGITELHVVESMHERKALMAELSDGFLALPGGVGTLEELFEVYTWGQLGLHPKPVALLDVDGYYRPLTTFLDHAVTEGFIRPEHRAFLLTGAEIDPLLDAMAAWRPPRVPKWLERRQA